jgi:aerobic carbon-monoxide dehydrogenase medium subunit
MYATNYHRPTSLSEAAKLFSGAADASYVAGGHTLLPAMKARLAGPGDLIDLRHIAELKGIKATGDSLEIGAAMTHFEVAQSADAKGAISTLAALAGTIGDAAVRHLGTIGGSIANNDPAADYPAAAMALLATIHTDRRQLSADEFFTGLYTTALQSGEIVTRVGFKIPDKSGYAKFRNPASRYPMAGVFVARHKNGSVRVAVTGAGNDGVFRWEAAEQALSKDFSAAALKGLTVDASGMMGDIHGSAEYRANLVAVMARRALQNLGGALAVA